MFDYTRYNLFLVTSTYPDLFEYFKDGANTKSELIAEMYSDSAFLIQDMERKAEGSYKLDGSEFFIDYNNNISEVKNTEFKHHVRSQFFNKYHDTQKEYSYNQLLARLLKVISDYQNGILDKYTEEIIRTMQKTKFNKKNQVFLSYAYVDKGISFALFVKFINSDAFLYVDWMNQGANKDSNITKKKLEDELKKSKQLLFLRTINSEYNLKGNHQIRQWCSWEIGNFYTKNKNEKYYIAFNKNRRKTKNDILDSFKQMIGADAEGVHGI